MEENVVEVHEINKFSDSCRICLKRKFDMKEMLHSFYDEFSYLQIYKTTCINSTDKESLEDLENITTKICCDCETKLLLFYDFKQKCNDSEEILIRYQRDEVKMDEEAMIIEEIYTDFEELEDQQNDVIVESLEEINENLAECHSNFQNENSIDPTSDYEAEITNEKIQELDAVEKCLYCSKLISKKFMVCHKKTKHPDEYKNQFETENLIFIPKNDNEEDASKTNCFFCKKDIKKNSILWHYQTIHCVEVKNIFSTHSITCDICKFSFDLRADLVIHMRQEHPKQFYFISIKKLEEIEEKSDERKTKRKIADQKYRKNLCEICGLVRTKEHMRIHSEEESKKEAKYPCSLCSAVFKKKNTLLSHKQKHKNLNYPCRFCDMVLNSWLTRRNHEDELHTNTKRFQCQYCDLRFLTSQKRIMHTRRLHTLEKPYKCTKCEKKFINSNHLKDHFESHNENGSSFTCNFCKRRYNRKKSLANHIRSAHKTERDSLKSSIIEESMDDDTQFN